MFKSICDWLVEYMNPDIIPYRISLGVLPNKKRKKGYNKHLILIRFNHL